jgi:hypothetical protein
MSTKARPVGSIEYVRVAISEAEGKHLTGTGPKIAFATDANEPSSGAYLTAEWETEYQSGVAVVAGVPGTPIYTRIMRVLGGPGQTFVPTATTYRIWYKFTDTPEVPARYAGQITFG